MKFFALFLLILTLITAPVLAAPGKSGNNPSNGQGQSNSQSNNPSNNGNSGNNKPGGNKQQNDNIDIKDSLDISVLPTASSSGRENCDPNFPWKNHGEYVSCVAKLKPGGQTVSEAAKSDIGKKNKNASASATPAGSPTPPATGSATPSASPSPEATSSGLISNVGKSLKSVRGGIKNLRDQIEALLELLNPFD